MRSASATSSSVRAEGGDQRGRQVGDEADGVGEDRYASLGQAQAAKRRVEGGEQAVVGKDLRAGQGVEQRRFSGVGIADQGNRRLGRPAPVVALQAPAGDHRFEFLLDADDAILDDPPVGLDLGLAGTAEEAETAALPFEVGPAADQPALLIFEMRQLDLQDAFPGMRPLPEDLEDQSGPVDHLGLPGALEIALLDRRQGVVDDHQPDLVGGDPLADLLDLAGAEERRGTIIGERHGIAVDDLEVDRLRQPGRFLEARRNVAGLAVAAPALHRYQDERPLRRAGRLGAAGAPRIGLLVAHSPSRGVAASSAGSNNWSGAPGMMVEIACL